MSKRIAWPPKQATEIWNKERTRHTNQDGEGRFLRFNRFGQDNFAIATEDVACCDCGLTHSYMFELHYDEDGDYFFMMRRAFRHAGTGIGPIRKRTRVRARRKK